jgi:hypothetical protein
VSEPTSSEAGKLARKGATSGLTSAELSLVAEMLAALADAGRAITEWQTHLGETEPATTYRVSNEASDVR